MLAVGQRTQLGQRLDLAGGRRQPVQTRCGAAVGELVENAGRDGLGGQLVERVDTDDGEHGRDGLAVRADVSGGEGELVG